MQTGTNGPNHARGGHRIKTRLLVKQSCQFMRSSFILFLAFFLQASATGKAQRINLSEKNATLQDVFRKIHRQTGHQFFYEDALLDKVGKVNVQVSNATLEEALGICFRNLPLRYEMVNNTIVVSARPVTRQVEKVEDPGPPPITVRGVVRNERNEPMAGISVAVKGTSKGTVTNENGLFVLEGVEEDAILVFTGTDVEPQEAAVRGRTSLLIGMTQRQSMLDEVQAIGYGKTTRRYKTGSVGSIKAEAIERQPVANPIQALQGRIAGASVTQTSGAIGSAAEIQIRGVNTIQAGNQPLLIVDGAILPDPSRGLGTAIGSYMSWGSTTMNAINPADIESIEILKDADATAIYGSRGANGVILITTKKGRMGPTRFNVDVNSWTNSPTYMPKLLNLSDYRRMRRDAFAMGNHNPTTGVAITPITPNANTAPDLLVWDSTKATTDWADYEFGNVQPAVNAQASLSGGDRRLSFYASGAYQKQRDITRGSPYQQRVSGNMNLTHTSQNDRFRVNFGASYIVTTLKPSRGGGSAGRLSLSPPNMPMRNADGSVWWPAPTITQNSLLRSPLAAEEARTESVTNYLIANMDVSYRIAKGLFLKTLLGYNDQLFTTETLTPSTSISPLNPGSAVPSQRWVQQKFKSVNIEPQLSYTGNLSKGRVEVLVGSTFHDRINQSNALTLDGYTSDLLLMSWAAASTVSSRTNSSANYRFNSVFGRFNYNWENRYLLNLTYRRDGSSRFGPKKQWGDFGAVGFGWIFTNEEWFKGNPRGLSYGKLRGSYGTTGNDAISDYLFTSLYGSNFYDGSAGLFASALADSSIGWETSRKLDLALETGFLDNRILFNLNWFRNRSTDLLASTPIPPQTGFQNYLTNIPAVVENKGWEFELFTQNTNPKGKFLWKTTFNLTLLKNRLIEFPGLESSSFASRMKVGLPVNSPRIPLNAEWSQVFERVDPATGLPVFTDLNKDGVINNLDRTYIGSAIPRTFGGLGNTFTFKGFELDMFFQFSQQLTTNWLFLMTYPGQLSNVPYADFYGNYWKNPGDEARYPRLFSGAASNTTTNLLSSIYPTSSAALVDLLYVRFKNLSLSYNIPTAIASKAKLSRAVVYVRGQNIGLWTSKKIYKDPELVQWNGALLKTWTAGVQLSF